MSKPRFRYPAIPFLYEGEVQQASRLYNVLTALAQRVEHYAGERGDALDSMVSIRDLLEAGIITPDQARAIQNARRR